MKHLRNVFAVIFGMVCVLSLSLIAVACGGDEGGNGSKTVGYTAEVYLEAESGYSLSAEHGFGGEGEIGASVTVTPPAIDGYAFKEGDAENVITLTLSENAADNVFKLYYDRLSVLSYDANAPQGTAASGRTASSVAGENGTATAAENGFTIRGYRFAGWSYTRNGRAEVKAGDTVTLTENLTLYAVWDRGYADRFGGTDYVFPLSDGSGKLVMQRGGAEFETELSGTTFSFTLPNGEKRTGKLFSDTYTFAYAQEDLAGEYIHHSGYWNKDDINGEIAPDENTKLTLDEYGSATFRGLDANGRAVTEVGYISIYSYGTAPEYIFLISEGANAGGGFVFHLGEYNGEPVYSSTNGEAGMYYLSITPDGNIYYLQDASIQLDGYGNLLMQYTDYTGEWEGRYWIENIYDFNEYAYLYKLNLRIYDDEENHTLHRLGYDVQDGILSISCYTMPLSDDMYVYVQPNVEAGEYANAEDGSTLRLDGFKTFADSAVYTVNGVTHYGSYETVWPDQGNRLTVIVRERDLGGNDLGRTYTFGIEMQLNDDRSFEIKDSFTLISQQSGGTGYRLLGGEGILNDVITVYRTPYEGVSGAYAAEYGRVNYAGGYTKLADGYVTLNTLGCAELCTFTRTELASDSGESVPKSMIFEVAQTYDNYMILYNVFLVFSSKGESGTVKNYVELTDEESGAKIWYTSVSAGTANVGALYFDTDGSVYTGSFSVDATSYYFGTVGTFYRNEEDGTVAEVYFDVELSADGASGVFAELTEIEYPVFTIDYTGALDTTVHLMIRGEDAIWSESGSFEGDAVHGTVRYVGETENGEVIMALLGEDGAEIFRFVMEDTIYTEPGYESMQITIYYAYNAAFDKTYTSQDGSLTLDGFHTASYTDKNGNTVTGDYRLSSDRAIVYVGTGRNSYTFDISDGLTLTDGIYGSYQMFAGGAWWTVTFDGHGNAAARLASRNVQGVYNVREDGSVLLFINLEEGVNSYRLRLSSIEGHGEADVWEEDLDGAFIGNDWAVLYLDGYDSGVYYYRDGSGWTTVYFEVLDEEIGYISIRDTGFNTQNILLDREKGTMSYPRFVERAYTYYGEDLSALIVGSDGVIYMNYTSGYYILTDSVFRAYLLNSSGDGGALYYTVDLGSAPVNGVWTVDGKKYYPWTGMQTVTLTGTVEVDYENTHESRPATLTFRLDGEPTVQTADNSATFTVGGETYRVNIISNYYDYDSYRQRGLAIVDWSQYEYSPVTEYAYNGNGEGTFKVEVVPREMKMVDGFERENGIESTLTEYRIGFGPISITSRKLSGHVYVGGGKYLDFTERDIETTYSYETDQGPRYNIVFEADGTTYSMQYNKEDSDYRLYLIGTYSVLDAGAYSVGAVKYFYSNGAYDFTYQTGDLCDFIIYQKTADGRQSVVAMSKGLHVGSDKTAKGWYLDIGGFDPMTGRGDPGKIFVVNFTANAASAAVAAYDFVQASQGDDEHVNSYFANLCLSGEAVADIPVLNVNGTFYAVESYTFADGAYTITLTSGEVFRMTLPVDTEGKHLTNSEGNWVMTLELIEE